MDLSSFIIITSIFLAAGFVKGVIGLGLPTVSLALLTLIFDLPQAMILMIVPSLVTNCWQAFVGEPVIRLIKHQWQFYLSATVMIFLGSRFLVSSAAVWFPALLGVLLLIYAISALNGKKLDLIKRHQHGFGTLFGSVNGLLTGMTGSFVVPGVLYLQSTGMQKDRLIQSMGVLFTLSTIALFTSLLDLNLQSNDLSMMSIYAVVPALCGMWTGLKFRKSVSERAFRKLFFLALTGLGLSLILETVLVSIT